MNDPYKMIWMVPMLYSRKVKITFSTICIKCYNIENIRILQFGEK